MKNIKVRKIHKKKGAELCILKNVSLMNQKVQILNNVQTLISGQNTTVEI